MGTKSFLFYAIAILFGVCALGFSLWLLQVTGEDLVLILCAVVFTGALVLWTSRMPGDTRINFMHTSWTYEIVSDADGIIAVCKEKQTRSKSLVLRFIEGRGSLKCQVFSWEPEIRSQREFLLANDDGALDYHRDPAKYVALIRDVEKKQPELVTRWWRLTALISLFSALWSVLKARAPYKKPFPKTAVSSYLRAMCS